MTELLDPPAAGASRRLRGRALASRFSRGHAVALIAALVAGAINVAALAAADVRTEVLAAATDLRSGTPIDSSTTRVVRVAADDPAMSDLLAVSQAGQGLVATGPVMSGSLLRRSDAIAATDGRAPRAMSIPVDVEQAVGGDLHAGDRVDVVVMDNGTARYLLRAAQVLEVPSADRGALGGLTRFHVVLAVDEGSALALAEAIDGGGVHLVRSTGNPEDAR